MKRILLISSQLIIVMNTYAVDRSVVCLRYGLQPGSQDFARCVGGSQGVNLDSNANKAPEEKTQQPQAIANRPPPIQYDIGKLTVAFQPDADAYYPSFSKRSGEQGAVVVRLIIDDLGSVEDVQILQSSSFPRLDRAGTEIGKNYKFKPTLLNGKAVRVSTNLLIKFNLKTD